MKLRIPRLRMLAWPNGSGKTTLKEALFNVLGDKFLGVDLNADEIEKRARSAG